MSKIESMAFSYDDLLLVPQYSEITPDKIDTSINFCGLNLRIPIISSPMDTVSGYDMIIAMAKCGGLGVLHRAMSFEEQIEIVDKVKNYDDIDMFTTIDKNNRIAMGVAVGVATTPEQIKLFESKNVDVIIIDTAHGHSKNVIQTIKTVKNNSKLKIVAGNIATSEASMKLFFAGADALRVGIGGGSACTTRIVAGCGIPQATAVENVAKAIAGNGMSVIADGGIKHSGDITKAIGLGAHVVMLGRLLSSSNEAPGFSHSGYKEYRGMGSSSVMMKSDRYSKNPSSKLTPEGVSGKIKINGNVKDILNSLVGGLKSGMGYMGASNISELQKNAKFVQITNSGIKESHPHGFISIDECANYNL